jgi:hypothetical protein
VVKEFIIFCVLKNYVVTLAVLKQLHYPLEFWILAQHGLGVGIGGFCYLHGLKNAGFVQFTFNIYSALPLIFFLHGLVYSPPAAEYPSIAAQQSHPSGVW